MLIVQHAYEQAQEDTHARPDHRRGRTRRDRRRRDGVAPRASLSLVAYSTPKAGDGEDHPGLAEDARTARACRSASRTAPSTDQAQAVAAGLPADLVFLSTGDDVNLLVDAGLVNSNWNHQSYNGIAANTVVVFAVRDGNPKHIKSWADLIKPGVQVVTPNPFSSGSAKWNILAAYGAQRRLGKTDKQATAYVQKLFKHVVSQDTSGSERHEHVPRPARATC